jgi:hypothetical protein
MEVGWFIVRWGLDKSVFLSSTIARLYISHLSVCLEKFPSILPKDVFCSNSHPKFYQISFLLENLKGKLDLFQNREDKYMQILDEGRFFGKVNFPSYEFKECSGEG